VPVYNEQDTIAGVLTQLQALPIDKQEIIIDDGSTDDTVSVIEKLDRYLIFCMERNRGKGCCVRFGSIVAVGDYTIIQDADPELNPRDILRLCAFAQRTNADAVYGSRMMRGNRWQFRSWFANKTLALLTNLLYGSRLTDIETCYKLIRTDLLRSLNLTSSRFEIEPEITCKLLKRGVNIVEVPVSYTARRTGKKIGWRDGVQAVWNILKWRLK